MQIVGVRASKRRRDGQVTSGRSNLRILPAPRRPVLLETVPDEDESDTAVAAADAVERALGAALVAIAAGCVDVLLSVGARDAGLALRTYRLLAGRMAIPSEIRDAAKVDGATGFRSFVHVSFPLLANLYLICTLLSMIFSLGDFNSVYFVTGGGPANSTHLLATLGVVRDMLELGKPQLGVAVVMSALPLLIPLVIILMRKLRTTEVQL